MTRVRVADLLYARKGCRMMSDTARSLSRERLAAAFDRFRDGAREFTTSSPARFAVLIFSSLILLFTALLSLPAAAASGEATPLADAVFTAVSTICVTGLSTVNMGAHWSPLGQVFIYIGVNVGALGVLTLASILGLIISKRLGLRAKLIAAGDSNPLRVHGGPVNEGQTVRLGEVGQLLATVALSTLVIEAGLAVLLYPGLLLGGVDPITALWEAPYFAAMAFTNTGFSPNPEGILAFQYDYFFLTVMMAGVFLGSIGFPVIYTLWRHQWHFRQWTLHAKLTIITTVLLFFAGAIAFLALEYNNPATFGSRDAWDTVYQSFFLSAMTRSGGFSVVDIGQLNGSSLLRMPAFLPREPTKRPVFTSMTVNASA
jgi:Trk-type K+ transport system membrane component